MLYIVVMLTTYSVHVSGCTCVTLGDTGHDHHHHCDAVVLETQ